MLRVGARIVASSSFTKSDVMRGTQLLLTASGRATLADSYRDAFLSGASAVLTSLDTSHAHLDAVGFFEDMSRDNDLAYYEVGKGNGEGGFALQNNGYTFLIPREMVSVGERRDAAGLLSELATAAVKQGRAAALAQSPDVGEALVGTTIQFSSREDGTHLADGSLHLGLRLENQILSAAKMRPDFFAIAGCASAEDVGLVATILARNAPTMERRYRINLKVIVTPLPMFTSTCLLCVPIICARPCHFLTVASHLTSVLCMCGPRE